MKKVKKFLSIIFVITMVISIFSVTASAETTSGTCGENVTWEFDKSTSTLTLSGEGSMYHYMADWPHKDTTPWKQYKNDITQVIINEGITVIGQCAFYLCQNLYFVTIPSSVTAIAGDAFVYTSLMCVNYLGSEEEWDNIYKRWNPDLYEAEKIYFKDDYKPVLDSGTCSYNIIWAYNGPQRTLTISGSGSIHENHWDNLGNIVPLDPSAFFGTRPWEDYEYEIEKIVINEGVSSIGIRAFSMFYNLNSIVIPSSVKKIEKYVFGYCNSLTDIYYTGTEEQWNEIVVGNKDDGRCNEELDNATIHFNYVECEHNYETSTIVKPSCEKPSFTTYICSICNEEYVGNIVPATGHIYEPVVTAPTCTEKGYTTYTCECGDSYIDDCVDATGHDHKPVVTAPTCTEQGYTTYICECRDSYIVDYVDATGHDYSTPTYVAPPCTEKGYTIYECHCGASALRDFVDITGHIDSENDGICDQCNRNLNPSDTNSPDTDISGISGIFSIFTIIAELFEKIFSLFGFMSV